MFSDSILGVRSQWYVGPGCMTKNNIEPKDIVKAKDYEEVYSLISNNTVIITHHLKNYNNHIDIPRLHDQRISVVRGLIIIIKFINIHGYDRFQIYYR